MNPEVLISGKIAESATRTVEKPPDTGELLKNLTADVSEAVEALQDGTDLLVQQAQHLLLHESVMATRSAPGHFRPGEGFVFDPATGVFHIDAILGAEEVATNMARELIRKERLRQSLGLNS